MKKYRFRVVQRYVNGIPQQRYVVQWKIGYIFDMWGDADGCYSYVEKEAACKKAHELSAIYNQKVTYATVRCECQESTNTGSGSESSN